MTTNSNSIDDPTIQTGQRRGELIIACMTHVKSWIISPDRTHDLDEIIAHMGYERDPIHEGQCDMQTMVAWAWCPDQQFTWESRGDSSSDSENVESPQPTVEPPTTGPQADLIATAHELAEIA